MKLIIGLGNPGSKYEKTVHNVGFMAVDRLALAHGIALNKEMLKGIYGKGKIAGEDVLIAKPQTFMNASGEFAGPFARYFKIEMDDIIVLYDDMEIDFGVLRLRAAGSSGGHNGMKSLIAHFGTEKFKRVRIGVGRPKHTGSVISHVLSNFSQEQSVALPEVLSAAVDAVEVAVRDDWHKAQSRFNGNVLGKE